MKSRRNEGKTLTYLIICPFQHYCVAETFTVKGQTSSCVTRVSLRKRFLKKVPFVINMFDKSLYLMNLIKTAFQIPSFIFVTLLH